MTCVKKKRNKNWRNTKGQDKSVKTLAYLLCSHQWGPRRWARSLAFSRSQRPYFK